MDDVILELQSINKQFGDVPVLKGIDLKIRRGEFITLLGSSGCGKTTTLRIISGLETPDSGKVLLEGKDVTSLEPNRRDVNTVFQNYALFPHMNVEANIGYSLKIKKRPKPEIHQKVNEMLALVQLDGYGARMPSELSGGQRQRVAIARAIINEPKILLLDEPLGALDLQLRRQMQLELKDLQKRLGITFIYITHDQEEALNMSDRIVVMDAGKFIQIGTPAQIYDQPKTSFVASFVGAANIINGTVTNIARDVAWMKNESGQAPFLIGKHKVETGMPIALAVRGEQTTLTLASGEANVAQDGIHGVVTEKRFSGGILHISVRLADGETFVSNRQGIDCDLSAGDKVLIAWSPESAVPVDLVSAPVKESGAEK